MSSVVVAPSLNLTQPTDMIHRTLVILSIIALGVVAIAAVATLPVWVVVYIATGNNVPDRIFGRIIDWPEDSKHQQS